MVGHKYNFGLLLAFATLTNSYPQLWSNSRARDNYYNRDISEDTYRRQDINDNLKSIIDNDWQPRGSGIHFQSYSEAGSGSQDDLSKSDESSEEQSGSDALETQQQQIFDHDIFNQGKYSVHSEYSNEKNNIEQNNDSQFIFGSSSEQFTVNPEQTVEQFTIEPSKEGNVQVSVDFDATRGGSRFNRPTVSDIDKSGSPKTEPNLHTPISDTSVRSESPAIESTVSSVTSDASDKNVSVITESSLGTANTDTSDKSKSPTVEITVSSVTSGASDKNVSTITESSLGTANTDTSYKSKSPTVELTVSSVSSNASDKNIGAITESSLGTANTDTSDKSPMVELTVSSVTSDASDKNGSATNIEIQQQQIFDDTLFNQDKYSVHSEYSDKKNNIEQNNDNQFIFGSSSEQFTVNPEQAIEQFTIEQSKVRADKEGNVQFSGDFDTTTKDGSSLNQPTVYDNIDKSGNPTTEPNLHKSISDTSVKSESPMMESAVSSVTSDVSDKNRIDITETSLGTINSDTSDKSESPTIEPTVSFVTSDASDKNRSATNIETQQQQTFDHNLFNQDKYSIHSEYSDEKINIEQNNDNQFIFESSSEQFTVNPEQTVEQFTIEPSKDSADKQVNVQFSVDFEPTVSSVTSDTSHKNGSTITEPGLDTTTSDTSNNSEGSVVDSTVSSVTSGASDESGSPMTESSIGTTISEISDKSRSPLAEQAIDSSVADTSGKGENPMLQTILGTAKSETSYTNGSSMVQPTFAASEVSETSDKNESPMSESIAGFTTPITMTSGKNEESGVTELTSGYGISDSSNNDGSFMTEQSVVSMFVNISDEIPVTKQSVSSAIPDMSDKCSSSFIKPTLQPGTTNYLGKCGSPLIVPSAITTASDNSNNNVNPTIESTVVSVNPETIDTGFIVQAEQTVGSVDVSGKDENIQVESTAGYIIPDGPKWINMDKWIDGWISQMDNGENPMTEKNVASTVVGPAARSPQTESMRGLAMPVGTDIHSQSTFSIHSILSKELPFEVIESGTKNEGENPLKEPTASSAAPYDSEKNGSSMSKPTSSALPYIPIKGKRPLIIPAITSQDISRNDTSILIESSVISTTPDNYQNVPINTTTTSGESDINLNAFSTTQNPLNISENSSIQPAANLTVTDSSQEAITTSTSSSTESSVPSSTTDNSQAALGESNIYLTASSSDQKPSTISETSSVQTAFELGMADSSQVISTTSGASPSILLSVASSTPNKSQDVFINGALPSEESKIDIIGHSATTTHLELTIKPSNCLFTTEETGTPCTHVTEALEVQSTTQLIPKDKSESSPTLIISKPVIEIITSTAKSQKSQEDSIMVTSTETLSTISGTSKQSGTPEYSSSEDPPSRVATSTIYSTSEITSRAFSNTEMSTEPGIFQDDSVTSIITRVSEIPSTPFSHMSSASSIPAVMQHEFATSMINTPSESTSVSSSEPSVYQFSVSPKSTIFGSQVSDVSGVSNAPSVSQDESIVYSTSENSANLFPSSEASTTTGVFLDYSHASSTITEDSESPSMPASDTTQSTSVDSSNNKFVYSFKKPMIGVKRGRPGVKGGSRPDMFYNPKPWYYIRENMHNY